MAAIPINRQKLYEQVWARPMRDVCKDYGITDVALAKICKKLKVPRPEQGYWLKQKRHAPPKLPALKPGDASSTSVYPSPAPVDAESEALSPDVSPAAAAFYKAAHELDLIVVSARAPRPPHPLLVIDERAANGGQKSPLPMHHDLRAQPQAPVARPGAPRGARATPTATVATRSSAKQVCSPQHKKTVAHVILRWLAQRGIVATPKSIRAERIAENFQVLDFELAADDMEAIAALDPKKSSFFDHRDPAMVKLIGERTLAT